jgi:probable F420-dependent oxidoreductase
VRYQFHIWPQDRYAGLDDIARVVRAGEDLGYAAVASGEHIMVPNGPEADVIGHSYFDPMVLFAYLASRTSTIELQFCALVVPYRHPALTARGLASIDQASGGRLVVVVGSGWAPSEFDALGLSFDTRGAVTDEYVDAMRVLWTHDRPSYDGTFVSFPETTFEPKCVQSPHVPLWIGGGGKVAHRRMAEYGSGWIPLVATAESLREEIARMREAVAAAGRDPEALKFAYHLTYLEADPYQEVASAEVAHANPTNPLARDADEAIELVAAYAEAGVTHLQLQTRWDSPDHYVEGLQRFAEEVMPHTADI